MFQHIVRNHLSTNDLALTTGNDLTILNKITQNKMEQSTK